MKKKLLVFFGEYRSFDSVIKHLNNLDKFDILVVTWDTHIIWYDGGLKSKKNKITEDTIKNILPNANVVISNFENSYSPEMGIGNIKNIIYHWKTAIDSIDNSKYDTILFHRTDILSEVIKIFNYQLENDTIYLDASDDFKWINDWFFVGTYDILKTFIDKLDCDDVKNFKSPHDYLANIIINSNLKYKNITEVIKFKQSIVRMECKELLDSLYENKKNVFDDDNFILIQECHDKTC